jgi:hypothetical protein
MRFHRVKEEFASIQWQDFNDLFHFIQNELPFLRDGLVELPQGSAYRAKHMCPAITRLNYTSGEAEAGTENRTSNDCVNPLVHLYFLIRGESSHEPHEGNIK